MPFITGLAFGEAFGYTREEGAGRRCVLRWRDADYLPAAAGGRHALPPLHCLRIRGWPTRVIIADAATCRSASERALSAADYHDAASLLPSAEFAARFVISRPPYRR